MPLPLTCEGVGGSSARGAGLGQRADADVQVWLKGEHQCLLLSSLHARRSRARGAHRRTCTPPVDTHCSPGSSCAKASDTCTQPGLHVDSMRLAVFIVSPLRARGARANARRVVQEAQGLLLRARGHTWGGGGDGARGRRAPCTHGSGKRSLARTHNSVNLGILAPTSPETSGPV